MYNLVHLFVSLLKELNVVSEEGAKELSKELSTKILPSNPEDAMKQVGDAVKAVEKKLGAEVKVEPWLYKLESLEQRVLLLEKPKTTKKTK